MAFFAFLFIPLILVSCTQPVEPRSNIGESDQEAKAALELRLKKTWLCLRLQALRL